MSVAIREARDEAELRAAMAVREAVFVGEQGVARELEADGRDGEAAHLVAVGESGEVLATLRLLPDGDVVKLGRLAVAAPARRTGIASRLLTAAEGWARDRGSRAIVLSAQTYAADLYLAAGYVPRGEHYEEAGIEHVSMELRLA